jgi:hypothetical protein
MSCAVLDAIAAWTVVVAAGPLEWLQARKRFLTASDVAAVLGLHPHKSRAAVLKDKRTPPSTAPERPVRAMRAGHFLEPAVLAWFADDKRIEAEALGDELPTWAQCRNPEGTSLLVRHPDESLRLAASPDGVVVGRWLSGVGTTLVEVKVHGPRQWALWDAELRGVRLTNARKFGVPTDLTCPPQHWVQLQTQLLCCGETRGWLVGNCGSERRDHYFEADCAFHARVEEATAEFWKEVERGN